jgi:hypothetical protein
MRVKPSLVCIFEQSEEVTMTRVGKRRLDPVTGAVYNLETNPPADEEVASRLIQASSDTEQVLNLRYQIWNDAVQRVEDAYKKVLLNLQTDLPQDVVTDIIADAIQNPISS